MSDFILLTRLSPTPEHEPGSLQRREQRTIEAIAQACPGVEWKHSYAVLGPYDFVDVFSADDMETALKVSSVMRALGYSHTEIWPAVERQSYRNIIDTLG